ncbi:MAG: flagellar motor switch protein FliN [Deltaproteobacteria bacterium]|nr:flagellar motor switch protein FliN [Deltaproteobacteria bacterium]
MEKEEQAKAEGQAAEATAAGGQTEKKQPQAGKEPPSQGTPGKETEGKGKNLDFVLDIPLEVTVELGRTRMIINDLLQLGQGSVIELTKLAGEPMEILVNQKLIARGEVVVVNEKFGVRLTDIISPMERVEQLR